MKQIKIYYDVDDTLNNLNDVVYGIAGLDKRRIRYFRIKENKGILTEEQMDEILKLYADASVAASLSLLEGHERITDIMDKYPDIVKIGLHSMCLSDGVYEEKEKMLKRDLKCYDRLDVRLETASHGHKSAMSADEIDILVEDCMENVLKSNARYNILIDMPYNRSEAYNMNEEKYAEHGIIRVFGLRDAIDTVEQIVEGLIALEK